MVQLIVGAEQVHEELRRAVDDGRIGEAVVAAFDRHRVTRRRAPFEVQPTDDQVFSFDRQGRSAGENHLAGRGGLERDGLAGRPLGVEYDRLILPFAVGHDQRVAGVEVVGQRRDVRGRGHFVLGRPGRWDSRRDRQKGETSTFHNR